MSPTFIGPESFPSGPITKPASCTWIGVGAPGGRMKVRLKYFDVPHSSDCSTNYVAVHDGFSTGSPLLEKMCGEKCTEYIVEGTSQFLTVHLEVTMPGQFRGFFAQLEKG